MHCNFADKSNDGDRTCAEVMSNGLLNQIYSIHKVSDFI